MATYNYSQMSFEVNSAVLLLLSCSVASCKKSLLSDFKVRVSSKNLNGKERMDDACFASQDV